MFSSIRDFLFRHRRKFYFSGAVIGGLAILSKVAQNRLLAWQDEHAKKLLEQQKRKQHYEKTLETTQLALLNLIPNIRRILERELDSDIFLQAIKDKPESKLELWKELKIVGFGRSICTIVCGAVFAPIAHVVMTVLAANTLDNDCVTQDDTSHPDESDAKTLSVEVQTKYLSCLKQLIEEQLPELVSRIMDIVTNSVSSLPLTRQLTLPQLESILQQILLSVTNNRGLVTSPKLSDRKSIPSPSILPWCQYLKEPECSLSRPESTERLRHMYRVTQDILNTDDFNEVVNTLVQVGLNYVLDEMAVYYFNTQSISPKPTKQILHEKLQEADSSETFSEVPLNNEVPEDPSGVDGTKGDQVIEQVAHTIAEELQCQGSETVSCMVVKLVPILNGIVHQALPTARKVTMGLSHEDLGYYNRLVVCSQLEALNYNVYDTLVLSAPYGH